MKPNPGVITPDDIPNEWVKPTTIPLRSTTLMCVVSGAVVGVSPVVIGFSARMWACHSAARAFDVIHATGTLPARGSPRCALRSVNPAFIAIATR